MTPTSIVAYLTLFAAAAFLFGLVSLLLGRLLRTQAPSVAKLEPYECGEPAVGSTAVRFDLRFYVVALVFLIFEVEVALFFPPATIFGKAVQLTDPQVSSAKAAEVCGELGVTKGSWGSQQMYPGREEAARDGRQLALAAMADLGVFFAVILLGFAYVWRQGDLNWVRATGGQGVAERNETNWRVVST
ncbi:MAG: NADH-quinone oxidoreductase subunit A [Thermoguttaceae bacterium]